MPIGFQSFVGNRRANIATLAALLAPVFIGITALAVDMGALYLERRELQSLADMSAISGATNLAQASQAVMTHLSDNGISAMLMSGPYDPSQVKGKTDNATRVWVEKGVYTPDSRLSVGERFKPSLVGPNALRVMLARPGRLYFGQSLIDRPALGASGTASSTAEAAFSIGSRIASLDEGILNALLSGLLGTRIKLKVGDYKALLATDVSALGFLNALATKLNVTAGTYDSLLKTDATIGQIAGALAEVTTATGATPTLSEADARVVLDLLGQNLDLAKIKLPVGSLLDLGSLANVGINGGAGYEIKANALEMLTAAAMLGGNHQAAVDSGLDLLGLAKVTLKLAIGEPPQKAPFFAVGGTGTLVRTSQVRLKLTVDVLNDGLFAELQLLNVHLPIFVDVGSGEAELVNVSCPTGRRESAVVTLSVKPSVAGIYIGDLVTDFYSFNKTPTVKKTTIAKIKLLFLDAIDLVARGELKIENVKPEMVSFSWADIDGGVVKNVSTKNLTKSLVGSLITGLDLELKLLGILPVSISLVTKLLGTLLTPLTAPLDGLINTLLQVLGVKVGEADVQVHGVNCARATLVQ